MSDVEQFTFDRLERVRVKSNQVIIQYEGDNGSYIDVYIDEHFLEYDNNPDTIDLFSLALATAPELFLD